MTQRSPDQPAPEAVDGRSQAEPLVERVLEEVSDLTEELAGTTVAARKDLEATKAARIAVDGYLWLMAHAPKSTRGKVITASIVCLVVLLPSLAMLYVSLTAGSEETQAWFSRYGYTGIFLANLASTATLFIPVPGLTAAAQALIASSADVLNPVGVGVAGGLGMALGEVTAYVAGMAGSLIAEEEGIKPPPRLKPLIDRITRWVDWLMAHYGMPTLFILSVVPNPLFEVAGLTAGATRFTFWKFMAAVTPGKVLRGLLLAYLGEQIIFG